MAAAFGALVSLQNNLNLIHNHPRHSFSFEDQQIQFLEESVDFLIHFMRSNDHAHGARREAAEALEMRIARAAEAAEDVVESHVVQQIRGGKTRSSHFLLDLQKVAQDMDYMRRKASQVYLSSSGMEPTVSAPSSSTPQTTSNKTTTTMVGFEEVLLQLLDKLTGVPSSRRVIPIVGMGGIGKTTLATNAFQHPLIVHHFDVCLWAAISQQCSIDKILVQLLSHLRKSGSGNVDEVGERLYKSLCGRRYLIILDDMWSVEAWDEMKFLFPDTQNGSRIVVTTRQLDVANHLAASRIEVSMLEEYNSWDLFCQEAFEEQGCPRELEEVGKKIVRKCKGLPLAIVVVAGHLKKSSMALDYWENVALSIMSSTENDVQCFNVLSLSYSYLPAHLKPCFLLLGAFPEDEKIYASDVIKLWIAEGLLQRYENVRMEEVAEYYLWDLYQRNLIVDLFGGNSEWFKLHDLVRELCLKIAKKEEFLCIVETPSAAINRERRVVIRGEVNHQTKTKTFGSPLRCLMYEGGSLSSDWKLLRTLDKVVTTSTSESIFQQLNLRYVNVELDYTTRQTLYYLPSSISLLWNLQILTISTMDHATVIAPYEIWEMLQLRHLEVHRIRLLDPLPTETSGDNLVLRNLHTLERVENFRLSEEACKRIPNVRELRISYSYSYSYCDEASSYYCPHNLCCFHQLELLALQFDGNPKWRDFVLSLTFPTSITRLNLIGCGIDWEELTRMVGSLPHLGSLRLYRNSVIGSEWTPVEGKFLGLKYLDIWGCDDLIKWNADSFHFPVLQSLRLSNLSKLEEFPWGIGEIPTLQIIALKFCSVSSTISAMRTVAEQEELGNDSLQLDVILRCDEETAENFNSIVQEEDLTITNLSLHLEIVNTYDKFHI